MNTEFKNKVSQAVRDRLETESQNSLAKRSGVNARYIQRVREGFETILDDGREIPIKNAYYYMLAEALGIQTEDRLHFETDNYIRVQSLCAFVQTSKRRALLDSRDSGLGKTYALERYAETHKDVLYIKVTSLMKGKDLIQLLLDDLNLSNLKGSATTKLAHITRELVKQPNYLIILDEMEACSPDLYRVLKDIEDATYRRCGLIISGLALREELKRGAARGKRLMPQLWRRFKANCVMLRGITRSELEQAANQVGIMDKGAINELALLIEDMAMLAEYLLDLRRLAIDKGHAVTADVVKSTFNPY